MSFCKDVDATVPRPVPFEHLAAKVGDVAKMQDVVILLHTCFLHGTGMKRWLVVWHLWWWQSVEDLLWGLETVHTDCPDLCDLAC